MDRDERGTFVKTFATLLSCVAVLAISVMLFVKLGGKMFDVPQSPDLNSMSISACEKQHGTPVLEQNGDAYKSCAINGKSYTRNVVK